MVYHNCDEKELLRIISQEELDFVANLRIPYSGSAHLWAKKYAVDAKIVEAIASGTIKEIEHIPVQRQRAPNAISDYIAGGDVKSMADGKMYDSKSQYYKSLKEKGMVIIGNEQPKPPKPKEVDWKQAVAETINRHGG